MFGTNHSYLCPLTTKGQLKHFHSDKKIFLPPYWALPLFRHILQQPVPHIQTPASSLNFAPDQLSRFLRALLFVLLPWEKNQTHNSSTESDSCWCISDRVGSKKRRKKKDVWAPLLQCEHCQMQKSIKLLLLDASFSWPGITFLLKYYVWRFLYQNFMGLSWILCPQH